MINSTMNFYKNTFPTIALTKLAESHICAEALSILGEPNIANDKKEVLVEEIFIKNMYIIIISRFVLGPYKKGLDKKRLVG